MTSPRSTIRIAGESLLSPGLTTEEKQRIEADAERDGQTSSLVVDIGGIATYPAIIPDWTDYHATLQDVAHEWMHQYLYFTPLGRRYFENNELKPLNETVANMVGREIGDILYREYPLSRDQGATRPASFSLSPAPAAFDFGAEMHRLRLEVDGLLARGRVADAERAMEQERQVFAFNGYYIRRINQAFFAFNGTYADTPASSDPVGVKLQSLRQAELTLKDFVHTVQSFTSQGDLDRAVHARGQ